MRLTLEINATLNRYSSRDRRWDFAVATRDCVVEYWPRVVDHIGYFPLHWVLL